MVVEQKTCPTQRKDQRDRECPPPPTSLTQGMEPQQSWREGTPPQGRPLGLMEQVEEGHQGNPDTTDLTGGTSASKPVLEGRAVQPLGNHKPKADLR